MASTADKAAEILAGQLEPGETLLAATAAQLDGGTMKTARRTGFAIGLGGLVGAAAAQALGPTDDGDRDRALSDGVTVVATNRRVILCSVTKIGANPKEAVAAVDRADIASVTTGTKRVALVKLLTLAIDVRSPDASAPTTIAFEVPKIATKDAHAVIAALGGA